MKNIGPDVNPSDCVELAEALDQYKETLMKYRMEDHPDIEHFEVYCDKLEVALSRVLKQILLTRFLPKHTIKTAKDAEAYVKQCFGEQLFDKFDMTPNQLKLMINAAVFDSRRTFVSRITTYIRRILIVQ